MRYQHIILLLIVLPAIFAADKCFTQTACGTGCKERGFVEEVSGQKTICRYPKIEECTKADACAPPAQGSTDLQACILIGMEKKGSDTTCQTPATTTCLTTKLNCSTEKIVCKSLGFIKSDTTDDCVYPKNCSTDIATNKPCDDGKACKLLGYEAAQDKTCKIPNDCTTGDNCQTPKTACIEAGYTKNSDNNNCTCKGPLKAIDSTSKKCVDCKSDSKCSDSCIALGWVTSGTKCIEPTDCLTSQNGCDTNKFCLVVKGFVAKSNADKNCMVPAKCEETSKNYCSNPAFVCVSTNGFTKKQTSTDCECVSPKVIEDNKCITKEDKTSSIKLLFSFGSLLALILV